MSKKKIEDLYFGIKLMDFNRRGLQTCNLFGSLRVLRAVALYVKAKKNKNPSENDKYIRCHVKTLEQFLSWCFGDVRWRAEYEFVVYPLIASNENHEAEKVDTFTMYVEPNGQYLRELVEGVSFASAARWLATDNKRKKEAARQIKELMEKGEL